jgi:hypothetical protein
MYHYLGQDQGVPTPGYELETSPLPTLIEPEPSPVATEPVAVPAYELETSPTSTTLIAPSSTIRLATPVPAQAAQPGAVMVGGSSGVAINPSAVSAATIAQAQQILAAQGAAAPAAPSQTFSQWLAASTGGVKNQTLLLGAGVFAVLALVITKKKKR